MALSGDLPDIQKGDQWWDTFAIHWQNLIKDHERIARLVDDPGSQTRGTVTPPTIRRAALVKSVRADDLSLSLREVRYKANDTPKYGNLEFGDTFSAYPEVPWNVLEYGGYVFHGSTPSADTPLITVRRDNQFWFAELPQPVEKMVVLREFFNGDPGSRFVMVQEVVPEIDADGIWTGELITLGDAVQVNVWHTMVAGDFAPFIWTAEAIDIHITTPLPLTWYYGVWVLKQRTKRAVSRRRGPVKQLDCTPAFALPGGG